MLGAVLGAGGPAENPIHTVLAFRDQYPSSMKWDNPNRAFFKNWDIIEFKANNVLFWCIYICIMIAAIALANIFIKSHISHFLFMLRTVKI